MLKLPLTAPSLHVRRFQAGDLTALLTLRRGPELARWQGGTVPSEDKAQRFIDEIAQAP